MHFGAALERKGLNEKKPRKKAIIVCYAGVATAMLIKEKIEQNFGHKIEVIKTCSQQEVSQELIDQVDLVLTTAELSELRSDKIKKINLFLDETDIQFIGNILKEDQKDEIDYRKIFRKELFFYDVEFKNKEEILEHMTREMQIRGLISKEGSKSVFKREEMSTTELGNMVAIPHAMSNDSEEAVVSVMILKKPILWENEKVQVVLLLNVPKSQYNMWEVVFKRLYQYLIGDQGVTKLIKDNVKLKVKASDWEEAVRIGAGMLVEQGCAKQSYVDGIIASVKELGPYIVIADGIAMPHTRPEQGAIGIGCSLITLDQPVKFDGDDSEVKVMICFSAVDSESHMDILKMIVEFVERGLIDDIAKATTYEELLEVIKEK